MIQSPAPAPSVPALRQEAVAGVRVLRLSGNWDAAHLAEARDALRTAGGFGEGLRLDLGAVARLDATGARLILAALPDFRYCVASPAMATLLEAAGRPNPDLPRPPREPVLALLGQKELHFAQHAVGMLALAGRSLLDLLACLTGRERFPWLELSANLHRAGISALPLLALVGGLVGVVLAYLGMQQLVEFGATVFIVDLLGMGIFREFGPVLTAILVAGRSGAAMAAQIGVMRITSEVDALHVMGIRPTLRLALPKVLALMICMPLLVFWTDVIALLAGSFVADAVYNFPMAEFYRRLPQAVSLTNLWIGLFKGFLFGALIGVVACYFGFRVKPDSGSLGQMTTAAVVTAITLLIVQDAILAILFADVD